MTVHFIGAGPGAVDLITLRGRDLIAACPVCLYAGSLVPPALLAHCPPGARIVLFAGSPKMADVLAGRGGRWYRRIGNIDWLRAAWAGDGPEAGGRA